VTVGQSKPVKSGSDVEVALKVRGKRQGRRPSPGGMGGEEWLNTKGRVCGRISSVERT
jgi:hypothetical protein